MLAYSVYRFIPGNLPDPAVIADNYLRVVTDGYYGVILLRTMLMSVAVTVIVLILAYPLAYTIVRRRSRWSSVLLPIILVPLMTSVVARSYGWTVLFGGSGVINTGLNAIGLPQVQLLFTLPGTIIALAEVLLPFMVLSLAGSLQQIDPTLERAAEGLGAAPLRAFFDVVLPLSLPGAAAGSLIVFVLSMSSFATPALVGGSSANVMATEVYNEAITALNWPLAAALSFFLLMITLGLTFLQGRILGLSVQARRRQAHGR